jgi:adenosylcobinamide amidohydrolase
MILPFQLTCDSSLLVAIFRERQRMLSWSLSAPGFQDARRVAWVEVRNADLPPETDPKALVTQRLESANVSDAVAMITSRSVARHHVSQVRVENITATCVATVGLSNGERVGQRLALEPAFGTINILAHISCGLSQAAHVEAISIVASARTAAVMDSGVRRGGVAITGTGTDCIVLAAPVNEHPASYAGMHTAVGEALGAAVNQVMEEGIATWRADFDAMLRSPSTQPL